MIDGTPEIVLDAIDLHDFGAGRTRDHLIPGGSDDGYERPGRGLIEMLLPLSDLGHVRGAPRSDLTRKHRPEPVDPEPHALVADVEAPGHRSSESISAQKATVVAIPRSCSRSSTLRSESGNRTYIITANWMISGDPGSMLGTGVLK